MTTLLEHSLNAVWIAVGTVWAVGAILAKPAVRREPVAFRLTHLALMALGIWLIFSASARRGPLAWRFAPDAGPVEWFGFGLTLMGAAFAVWARLFLGGNWSAMVTIKKDHQLVRKGPYAVVRHPIYSGFLLGLFGTALAFGQISALVGLALGFVALWFKAQVEERFMVDRFGDEYARYRHDVKALIPYVL